MSKSFLTKKQVFNCKIVNKNFIKKKILFFPSKRNFKKLAEVELGAILLGIFLSYFHLIVH